MASYLPLPSPAMNACVADVMTWTSLTLRPECPAVPALESLVAAEAQELFVVDADDSFLGIVTDFEFLKAELNGSLDGLTIEQLMQRRPITIAPEASLLEAARLFREGSLNRIAVIRSGRLLGMICRGDVLRWMSAERAKAQSSPIQAPKFLQRAHNGQEVSAMI